MTFPSVFYGFLLFMNFAVWSQMDPTRILHALSLVYTILITLGTVWFCKWFIRESPNKEDLDQDPLVHPINIKILVCGTVSLQPNFGGPEIVAEWEKLIPLLESFFERCVFHIWVGGGGSGAIEPLIDYLKTKPDARKYFVIHAIVPDASIGQKDYDSWTMIAKKLGQMVKLTRKGTSWANRNEILINEALTVPSPWSTLSFFFGGYTGTGQEAASVIRHSNNPKITPAIICPFRQTTGVAGGLSVNQHGIEFTMPTMAYSTPTIDFVKMLLTWFTGGFNASCFPPMSDADYNRYANVANNS